jgi:hypothetical protein
MSTPNQNQPQNRENIPILERIKTNLATKIGRIFKSLLASRINVAVNSALPSDIFPEVKQELDEKIANTETKVVGKISQKAINSAENAIKAIPGPGTILSIASSVDNAISAIKDARDGYEEIKNDIKQAEQRVNNATNLQIPMPALPTLRVPPIPGPRIPIHSNLKGGGSRKEKRQKTSKILYRTSKSINLFQNPTKKTKTARR